MSIRCVQLRRFSVTSRRSFGEVVSRVSSTIGRPDAKAFHASVVMASNMRELTQNVSEAVGSSGLMEFARFDQGEILRKEPGSAQRKILRLLVGNPLIMKMLVTSVPDAGSYAPVTLLIGERDDGVHLSYDLMASLIGTCADPSALATARDLDETIQRLLCAAAR